MNKKIWLLISTLLIAAMMLSACATPAATEVPTAAPAATEAATVAPAMTEAPTTAPAMTEAATTAPAMTEAPTTAPAMTEAATTAPGTKPVKITIWHQWEGTYLTAITAAFKDYEAAHPGVTIDLSKPDNVSDALKVAIPAGNGPDIIGWANDQIGAQALVGNIVDLNSLGVDKAFLDATYGPAAVNGVIWSDKIWALPESQEAIALVSNKAMLPDASGLPTDPSNFDDLLAKAKDFATKNPGKFLFCNQGIGGNDPYHVAPVFFGFGVPSYVDDKGNAYLDTPEAVKAATWLTQIKAYLPKEASADICKADFLEGKVAAWWTGPWSIADIEKAKIDYNITPMGKPFVGIKTLMISKNAVDRGSDKTALDIIKYFTSTDVQKKVALANKTIPANLAAFKDPAIQALATVAGFGASANLGVPMSPSPYANAQWTPVGDATQAIWTGSQKPDVALKAAQTAILAAIAAMK